MNAVISGVVKTQTANPASASKLESQTIKSAAEEVTGGQNTASETSVSSKYDTLELSKEYVKYKTQGENSALYDKTSQLNSTVIQYAAANAKNGKGIIYNYQLYAYTESELRKMLYDGEIDPEEYENEMADRDPKFKKSEERKRRSSY